MFSYKDYSILYSCQYRVAYLNQWIFGPSTETHNGEIVSKLAPANSPLLQTWNVLLPLKYIFFYMNQIEYNFSAAFPG